MIYSFPPIVNEQSRILILGSMPSVRSLEQQQYYGNRQNYFWPMLFELFAEPFSEDYTLKQQLILRHHLALWDVLACCEREGSLDSQITNEFPHDFAAFFKRYPEIQTLFFNGGKSAQSFKKHFPEFFRTKCCYQMPSTSPAHTMRRDEKLKHWQILRTVLMDMDCF